MNDEQPKKKDWVALYYTLDTEGLKFTYPDHELEALEHMWALPSTGGN